MALWLWDIAERRKRTKCRFKTAYVQKPKHKASNWTVGLRMCIYGDLSWVYWEKLHCPHRCEPVMVFFRTMGAGSHHYELVLDFNSTRPTANVWPVEKVWLAILIQIRWRHRSLGSMSHPVSCFSTFVSSALCSRRFFQTFNPLWKHQLIPMKSILVRGRPSIVATESFIVSCPT